jgi:hypothetical protein
MEVCVYNIMAHYGRWNAIIGAEMRDRIVNVYRYLLCDLLPALEFISSAMKLKITIHCFDFFVKIWEATRLRLDHHPHAPCKHINDLLSTALQSLLNSEAVAFLDPFTRCGLNCRGFIYIEH